MIRLGIIIVGAMIVVTLSNAQSSGLISSLITDDDPPVETPTVTLSVDPTTVIEVILEVDRTRLNEGQSVQVTVTLNDALDQAVTIPLDYPTDGASAEANLDYTPLPELTIAAGQTTQSGTIAALADEEQEDEETFTVTLGALPPEVVGGRILSHTITILDRTSTPNVSLYVDRNSVDEGQQTNVEIVLSGPVSSDVTIPVELTSGSASIDDDVEVLTTLFLVIAGGETEAQVLLRAVDDDLIEGSETFTVALGSLPTTVVEGSPSTIEITINDNDVAHIIAPASVVVREGAQETIQVSLTAIPSSSVSIEITGYVDTDLGVSPNELMFTLDNWDEPQDVTLTAEQDEDILPDDISLLLTASGGEYSGVTHTVEVTIIDGDQPGLVVPASLEVNEGASESFDVRLSKQPTGEVTVMMTGTAGSDLDLDRSVLTFTESDWDQPQPVELTAQNDPDAVEDDPVQLMLNASGGGYDGVSETLIVRIIETDQIGIVVDPRSLRIEEGGSDALSVVLTSQPSANVSVSVTGYETTDLKVPTSLPLTFTPSDWNSPQEISLIADTDSNTDNEEVTLSLRASGGGYDGQTAIVQVTIVDLGLPKITIYDGQAKESDGIIRLNIELSHSTDQPITVEYTSADETATAPEDYISSRGIVIFDPDSKRGIVQFQIKDDEVREDTETFTVTLTKATNAEIARRSATATILDDDGVPTIAIHDAVGGYDTGLITFEVVLSAPALQPISVGYRTENPCLAFDAFPSILTVPEGSSNEVSIRLNNAPSSEVIISTSEQMDLLVHPQTLTFTAENWSELQAVTVTAAEDTDAINDTLTLNLYASSEIYHNVQSEVLVIISDDEEPSIVLKSNEVMVTEGSFSHFEARLASSPTSSVMVSINAPRDLTVRPSEMTFTSSNWATMQSVIVAASEDNDIDDDVETLLLTATGGDYHQVNREVMITIQDNDVAGIAISPNTLTVPEGASLEFNVQLNTAPAGNILLTIDDQGDLTPNPKRLAFSSLNWNQAQSVSLTASEDEDQENDQEILILTGSGAEYSGIVQPVSITVIDNDLSIINLIPDPPQTVEDPTTGTLHEGETNDLQIVLGQKPIADVTIEIYSSNTSVTISPSSLTFTPSNWDIVQTVVITIANDSHTINDQVLLSDDLQLGRGLHVNDVAVITLMASGGGYDGISQQRKFTIIDQTDVSIQHSDYLPESVEVWGNYPNPFSTLTNVVFDLPEPAQISLIVTDLLGRTVLRLSDQWYGAGKQQTAQIQANELPSGIYYYRLDINIDGKITGHSQPMMIIQ